MPTATFRASIPDPAEAERPPHDAVLALHRRLLAVRHARIVPHLPVPARSPPGRWGEAAVLARWRLGDGSVLTIASNLGPARRRLRGAGASRSSKAWPGPPARSAPARLPPRCTVALIDSPDQDDGA